ncbi:hypothetical protein LguiB_001739 [Lonicera macranthoides]
MFLIHLKLQTLWEHNKMSMLNLVASLVKLKHAKNLLLPSLTSSGRSNDQYGNKESQLSEDEDTCACRANSLNIYLNLCNSRNLD